MRSSPRVTTRGACGQNDSEGAELMSAQHPAGPVDPVTPLDGNVLAGRLGALFAVEVTTLVVVCGACGASGALAEAVVELDGKGIVVVHASNASRIVIHALPVELRLTARALTEPAGGRRCRRVARGHCCIASALIRIRLIRLVVRVGRFGRLRLCGGARVRIPRCSCVRLGLGLGLLLHSEQRFHVRHDALHARQSRPC